MAPACSRSMRAPVARGRPPPEAPGAPPAGGTGAATAHLAGGRDVPGQCVAHLLGVLVRQIDLIGRAVEGEADGLVGGEVLVEVVAQDDLNLARHSVPSLFGAAREPYGIAAASWRPHHYSMPRRNWANVCSDGATFCEANRPVLVRK